MIDHSVIQTHLDQKTQAQVVPCIALGIVTPDFEDSWISGYKTLIPHSIPLSQEDLFDLASLTKVIVTTTLILKLIEEQTVTLETKVASILPDFKHAEITIFHLLTHTSGLCADHKGYKEHQGKASLRAFIMSLPLDEELFTKVIYTDFGFILLGLIAEVFLGPLDEAAKRLIFEPLGMNNTQYRPFDKARCVASEVTVQRGLIQGVVHDGKAFNMGEVSGNAGLFSTLNDMMIFAKMMLTSDERVLKNTTKALLRKTYTDTLDHQRTLGWYRHDESCSFGTLASDDILYHTGFSGTSIAIDFTRQVAIVILTNRIHPSRDNDRIQDLRKELHDTVFTALQSPLSRQIV
jgi:CubicO group peptidase (beta-lactamase class C family)